MVLGLSKASPEPVAFPSLIGALVRYSDKNLDFIFEESDREGLMQIGLDRFEIISRELGKTITTHEQLCDLLLPKKKKTKPKKTKLKKIKPRMKTNEFKHNSNYNLCSWNNNRGIIS